MSPSLPNSTCLFCQYTNPRIHTLLFPETESPHFYVRYDNFPASPGHVEIVPKEHIESYFDLPSEWMEEEHNLARKVYKALDQKYSPVGYTIGINEGRAAGRTVDHAHKHFIPRYKGDVADPRGGIRQIFPNCDPDSWR